MLLFKLCGIWSHFGQSLLLGRIMTIKRRIIVCSVLLKYSYLDFPRVYKCLNMNSQFKSKTDNIYTILILRNPFSTPITITKHPSRTVLQRTEISTILNCTFSLYLSINCFNVILFLTTTLTNNRMMQQKHLYAP